MCLALLFSYAAIVESRRSSEYHRENATYDVAAAGVWLGVAANFFFQRSGAERAAEMVATGPRLYLDAANRTAGLVGRF